VHGGIISLTTMRLISLLVQDAHFQRIRRLSSKAHFVLLTATRSIIEKDEIDQITKVPILLLYSIMKHFKILPNQFLLVMVWVYNYAKD
jgi:hypothetical protein